MTITAAGALCALAWACAAGTASAALWVFARALWRACGDRLPPPAPWVVALPALALACAVLGGADAFAAACLAALLASAFVAAGTDHHAGVAHDAVFVPGGVGAIALAVHGPHPLASFAAAAIAVAAFAALSAAARMLGGEDGFGGADFAMVGVAVLAFGPWGGLAFLLCGLGAACAYAALQLVRGRFVWGRGDAMPLLPALSAGVAVEAAVRFGPGSPIFHALGLDGRAGSVLL